MRAIVVGGGIYGQVVTWRLALEGAEVTQIEAVSAGHLGSGSGDRSRIIRALYGEAPFVEAGARSLSLWRAWEEELGVSLAGWLGVLYLVRAQATDGDAAFAQYVAAGKRHLAARGIAFEELEPGEIARRFPAIRIDGLAYGVIEPGAGMGASRKATRAIARAGLDTGRVGFVTGRVTELIVTGDRVSGVRVEMAGETRTFEADVVVLAAGLGGAELVRQLAGNALPIRKIPHFVAYFDVPHPEGALLSSPALPPFAELGSGLYGFPDDGEAGFKIAWHEPLRADSGDAPRDGGRDVVTDAQIEALRAAASERFPALARARCRSTYTCAYDATPDEQFQIGWVPGTQGLYFVGGMSGHGYKHAPAIGVAVAADVLGKHDARVHLDLSPWAVRLAPGRGGDGAR